jgi:hypothetical protein
MGLENCRVLLCYKNFSKECNVSHIGLGVTALYTAKSLVQAGIRAQALPIVGGEELWAFLNKLPALNELPVTHVVISALFIGTEFLAKLTRAFPHVKFAVNCHSNVGFLQSEPAAITLIREAIDLEVGTTNFFACANSKRLGAVLQTMYGHPIQFLPNLYYLSGNEPIHRPVWNGCDLRIGAFGALRVQKNFSTAVTAAIELATQLKTQAEIWINCGRDDGAGNVVLRTAEAWTRGLPNISLKKFPWSDWPTFRRMIGSMNILLQPSYTETFNNVTADGIAEGVPSVVSDVIDWCPLSWQASTDDPSMVASVARRLLMDSQAPIEGYNALKDYRERGITYWKFFLGRP